MQLVKKTQKDWRCSQCMCVISKGSRMWRDSINKWTQFEYCLECGLPKAKEKLQKAKECFKAFGGEKMKSDNPMSAYMGYKRGIHYFEKILSEVE